MNNDHAIMDAVVTWVDGNDLVHQTKRLAALMEQTARTEVSTGRDTTRFLDNGELWYCLTSIRKFAPWIRRIFLVTDNQVPGFLTPDMQREFNITIVDHSEIFEGFEWALPTFNTRTIETALWRIPGLAPRFIYFNDIFIISRKVKPKHFFNDSMVVLRGQWSSISNYGQLRMEMNRLGSYLAKRLLGITRSMHLLLQIRSAQLAGFEDMYFRVPHVPHPIRTSTLKSFFERNQEAFEKNIRFKFRNTEQFSSIFLANHLEIQREDALVQAPDDVLMINGETDIERSVRLKLKKIRQDEVRFVCLQGFEKFSEKQQYQIQKFLNQKLETEKLALDFVEDATLAVH